jgi:hypothetical protein
VRRWARKAGLRALARRLLASLMILSYVTATVGVPLPAARGKDLSRPFPCQNRACGCRSAEECWHHCCCFTREEHVTWARSLGIEPPPAVDHSKDGGWRVPRQRDLVKEESESKGDCPRCKKNAEASSNPVNQSCDQASGKEPAVQAAKAHPHAGRAWLLGPESLRCRGLSTLWISTGAVYFAVALVCWIPALDQVERLAYSDSCPIIIPQPPSDPPPALNSHF